MQRTRRDPNNLNRFRGDDGLTRAVVTPGHNAPVMTKPQDMAVSSLDLYQIGSTVRRAELTKLVRSPPRHHTWIGAGQLAEANQGQAAREGPRETQEPHGEAAPHCAW